MTNDMNIHNVKRIEIQRDAKALNSGAWAMRIKVTSDAFVERNGIKIPHDFELILFAKDKSAFDIVTEKERD